MRNLIITLSFIFALALPEAFSQATAKSAFVTAPSTVLPLIDRTTRLDMVDYFESGSDHPSKNILEADTRILAMNDRLITIRQGSIGKMTIAVLPMKKGEILMTVKSVKIPAEDSHLEFYSTRWKLLDSRDFFVEPKFSDWFGKLPEEKRKDIQNVLPFITFKADFDPGSQTLTLTPTVDDVVEASDFERLIKPYMAEKLIYKWNGKKFVG